MFSYASRLAVVKVSGSSSYSAARADANPGRSPLLGVGVAGNCEARWRLVFRQSAEMFERVSQPVRVIPATITRAQA